MTPDQKFVQDMNDKFAEEMNPGKNPISDFWDYRLFTDDIAVTGHDICGYLGSHSYDETAQQFKLSLPLAYPSDSGSREFVDEMNMRDLFQLGFVTSEDVRTFVRGWTDGAADTNSSSHWWSLSTCHDYPAADTVGDLTLADSLTEWSYLPMRSASQADSDCRCGRVPPPACWAALLSGSWRPACLLGSGSSGSRG